MIAPTLLLSLLSQPDAHAQKYEVAVTTAVQGVRDPRWETVSSAPLHTPGGLVAGMEVSKGTSIIVGFNTGSSGSKILVPTVDDGTSRASTWRQPSPTTSSVLATAGN